LLSLSARTKRQRQSNGERRLHRKFTQCHDKNHVPPTGRREIYTIRFATRKGPLRNTKGAPNSANSCLSVRAALPPASWPGLPRPPSSRVARQRKQTHTETQSHRASATLCGSVALCANVFYAAAHRLGGRGKPGHDDEVGVIPLR